MMNFPTDWLMFAQAAAPADAGGMPWWGKLLIVAAVMIGPFVLGSMIAHLLKLKDLGGRIGVVLFAATFGLTPFVWHLASGGSMGDALKKGIDLAGGTNLVFQVDVEGAQKAGKEITNDLMDRMVGAVSRRLDPANQEQITVRRVGSDRIEVIIPGADRQIVDQKKRLISRLGSLEFAILANRRDHKNMVETAEKARGNEVRQSGHVIARWVPVASDADGTSKDVSEHGDVVTRIATVKGQKGRQFLVVLDPDRRRRVTGKYLTRARSTTDQNGGLAVGFQFNTQGGYLFQALTSRNQPLKDGFKRRLAILLDGKIYSAPNLNGTISTNGIIEGRFTQVEIDELVSVLNAGALEVPIFSEPINEYTIDPLLGHDVQEKGINAILIAGAGVFLFMLGYYLFSGVVADLCLLLNLILVMGAMAFIDAAFTLPGLAAIVLTIGMAVDANVLIFERIREELHRGSSVRMAIQNGFGRAFTTIVDANVTTLITAVVLYMIGTDQVRGFAVTLFIGIVMSMFTALYFGRLVFDIWERKRWLKKIRMLHIIGSTHWDFIGKKWICGFVSLGVAVVGLAALAARGSDILDIDFSGGTMVTCEFVQPQSIEDVRGRLKKSSRLGSSVSVEQLRLLGEQRAAGDDRGTRFRVRSKVLDPNAVKMALQETFADSEHKLRYVTVEAGPVTQIADDATSNSNATIAEAAAEFSGGHQVELTFSGEVPTSTAADYLADQLAQLKNSDNIAKYEDPGSLLAVAGIVPKGTATAESTSGIHRYKTVLVMAGPDLEQGDFESAVKGMQQTLASSPIFDEVNTFASSVASEMQTSAMMAMLASLVAIVAYLWFRFQQISFGLAAVVALVHDVTVALGLVALASYVHSLGFSALGITDFKINLPMIAAFMTIVGYSLNDTIVVFDRVREVRGRNPALTEEMLNTSVNQTLSRTLLTSFTTFVVVLILYTIGGEGIHGFAFCLVIGVVVGTYSSVYVASPALLWLMNRPGSDVGRATAATTKTATAGP